MVKIATAARPQSCDVHRYNILWLLITHSKVVKVNHTLMKIHLKKSSVKGLLQVLNIKNEIQRPSTKKTEILK